jgi:putative Ca2+/H+ antiporter (TMEM165/GDT1 family)
LLAIFLATYGTVFIAEIVGDKLLYTTGVLATRYRWLSIAAGMALAFTLKMGVAVAVGGAIAQLFPRWLIATVTASSFVGVALTLWRKPDVRKPKDKDSRMLKGALVAFAAIFLSEWGDVGMITAGAMSVKFVWSAGPAQLTQVDQTSAAVLVWLGAVGAMVTKGTLAITLGASVRGWIASHVSPRVVRYLAVAAILVLGVLSVLETLGVLVG